jgi:hypothetical protein
LSNSIDRSRERNKKKTAFSYLYSFSNNLSEK